MDGVPEMTQPYVYPGDGFDYVFTPPDAGTFWYHPHCNTLTQMGHGLTGVIVVEDPADPVFDAEIVLNLRDWRLGKGGAFIAPFKPTRRRARRHLRHGPHRQLAAGAELRRARRRPRARPASRRPMSRASIRSELEGAPAMVVALDGNPVDMPFPLDRLTSAPASASNSSCACPMTKARMVTLGNFRGSHPWTIATLARDRPSLKRDIRDVKPLPANPIAEADLSVAERIPLDLTATAEHAPAPSICGTLGYTFWAINKVPWPGDTPDPVAPLSELKLGRSYVLQVATARRMRTRSTCTA